MNALFFNLLQIAKALLAREEGQNLSEYALVVALISFGSIAGEGAIANHVNQVFVALATTITTGVQQQ